MSMPTIWLRFSRSLGRRRCSSASFRFPSRARSGWRCCWRLAFGFGAGGCGFTGNRWIHHSVKQCLLALKWFPIDAPPRFLFLCVIAHSIPGRTKKGALLHPHAMTHISCLFYSDER